jgi:hypothetical protein
MTRILTPMWTLVARGGVALFLALLLGACNFSGRPQPDFILSLNPTSLTVQQGSSNTTQLTITPQGGFTGTVSLSLVAGQDQVPQGLSLSPQSVQVSGTSPVPQGLTVSASASTPTGTYRLKVRGTSGNLTREAGLTVTVSASGGGSGGGGSSSGTVNTPGGQVQVALQGGTFVQSPTPQSVTPPQGFQAPYGGIAFAAQVAQGGSLTVTLTFPQAIPQGAVLKKYLNSAWRDIPGVQLSGSTATYQVVDGGPLDADGQANGQVVDPVALLVPSSGGGGAPQISFEPSVQPPLYFVQGEVSPERDLGDLVVQPGTYRGRLTLEVLRRSNNTYLPSDEYRLEPDVVTITGSEPIRTSLKLRQLQLSYPNATVVYQLAFRVKGEDGTTLSSFEIGEVWEVPINLQDCRNYSLEPDAEGRWHLGALAEIGGKVCVALGPRLDLRFSLGGSSGIRVVKAVDLAPSGSGSNYHVYFGGAPASEGVYTDTLRVEPNTPGTFSYVEFPIAFHVGSKVVFSDNDGILVVAPRTPEGTEFGVYRTYTDAYSEELRSGGGTSVYVPGTNPFPYLRGSIWWRYSYYSDYYGNYYESLVATDLRTFTDLGPAVENFVGGGTTYKDDLPCERGSPRMILSDGTIICLRPVTSAQPYLRTYYKVYRITPSQGVAEENIPETIPYSSCDGLAYRDDIGISSPTFWLRPGAAYFYYVAFVPDPDPTVGCSSPRRTAIPYRYDFASRTLQPISSIPRNDGYRTPPNFYKSNVLVSEFFVCALSSRPDYLDDCLNVPSGYTAVGEQPSADTSEWLVLLRSDDGSFQVWQPFAPGGSRFLGNPVSPQGSVAGYALAYPWLVLALRDTSVTTRASYVIQALNVLDGRTALSFLAEAWSPHLYPAWRQ